MKRVCVLLLLMATGLLLVACPSQAADLQAGSYAMIREVDIWVYDMWNEPNLYDSAWFATPTGTYGPFQLTNEPLGSYLTRTVRVPTYATNVTPGTALELPIYGTSSTPLVARISARWETNYDSSQMRLEFAQRNLSTGAVTVLWQQNESGWAAREEFLAQDLSPDGLFFRVVVAPEPCALAGLFAPVSLTIFALGRRGRSR